MASCISSAAAERAGRREEKGEARELAQVDAVALDQTTRSRRRPPHACACSARLASPAARPLLRWIEHINRTL
nr:unnamed protein product [Digitaria exilis]